MVIAEDGIYRVLSREALADWEALAASPLWPALRDAGRVVATEPAELEGAAGVLATAPAGVLRHERIPFVSYPYEWPFAMLRDAALLQLDLNRRALREDLTLKDASPVQRAVPRHRAGVHRHRLVRAAAAGRAVGRLPPVLHAATSTR